MKKIIDEDYYNSIAEDIILKEAIKARPEELKKVREKIEEFKKEIYASEIFGQCGEDWARNKKIEFLENELRDTLKEMNLLEASKVRLGIFFFDDIRLKKLKKKYKNLYYRYAMLRGNKEEDEGKFSEDVIERCRKVPVESLVDSEAIDAGDGKKKCICPFHSEKTGSFFIFKDNSFHCFGCKAHGNNAIDFIMKSRNCNFYEAVKLLKDY